MADFRLGRIKFKWQGQWLTATAYVVDDVVRFGSSSYVCVTNHTSGTWATDLGAAKWELMLEGGSPTTTLGDISYRGSSTDQRLAIGTTGQALMVNSSGIPAWTGLVEAQNVYYVSEDGSNANDGKNLNKAFKTIKYAVSQVVGPAVIQVKTGVYQEQLPIVVPAGVSVIGDSQRTTEIQPVNISATGATRVATTGSGVSTTIIVQNSQTTGNEWQVGAALSGTGISGTVTITAIATNTPTSGFTTLTVSFTSQVVTAGTTTITSNYSEGTMWQLSNGSLLHKMFFTGMTGFSASASAPEDIREATIKGVYVALNPASTITTKSPYVLECSSFSTGGIGAVVDGDVHASGNKSIVFHAYTCINGGGVGFWVNGQGKAEIVSCFTYYCWFGYTTTNGGKIRSLSGNNSYGRYGVVSKGFDTTETTIDGTVYGNQLAYTAISLTGTFAVNETITGSSSGAVGTITNIQTSANKLYYKITSGTFTVGETFTGGTSGATAVIAASGVTGQKGFVLVLTGLASEPKVGGSIEFVTGDTGSYVIKSVSGTYTNSASVLVLALAGEKVTPSTDGTAFKIRYAFSQARLTGHDFLSIGTGNATETNYPGTPSIPPSQANEVIETYPGRVFYVSTDQDGNFRVGDYFKVDQATGSATLNANAFDLSGLTSLRLGSIGAQLGELVSEFSSDDTLSGNSNSAVPTEAAVRNYLPQVATNIIPNVDNTRDLGSPSKRWAHVYVGPGSVTIGTLTLTDNSGAFTVSSSTATPPTLSVPEINTGSVRYFQNNIIGGNSNEDIIIDTSGTGKLQVLADLNMTGTLSGPATFNIDPAAVGDNTGTVVIKGNLQVDGTTTTVNSTTLTVADKNIVLGSGAANDAAVDGAGITVESGQGNKTFNWVDATDSWTSSEHLDFASGKKIKIAGTAGADNKFLQTTSSGMQWADAAVTVSDITTNATYYPLFTTTTSGTVTTASVTSTKLSFNPSTGVFNTVGTVSVTGQGGFQTTVTGGTTLRFYGAAAATHNWDVYLNSTNLRFSDLTGGGSVVFDQNISGATATFSGKIIAGDNTTSSGALVVGSANSFAGGLVLGKPSTYSGYISATDNLYMRAYASGGTGNGSVVVENASGTAQFTMNTSNGNLTIAGTFTESSSIALKENVNPITNALDAIMSLVGVTYDRKNGSAKNEAGLIAEDVDKILPNLVSHKEDGSAEGIHYTKLTAYLIEAIKSLKAEIDELKGNK